MKSYTHPKICFITYTPPRRTTPYRIVSIITENPSRIPQRFEDLELANRPSLIESLDQAWLDGARVLVILGPEAFAALGHQGRFLDFRGSILTPVDLETNRPWKVIATIDPASKAAYIRNGYATYKSDLAKALSLIDNPIIEEPESIQSGADLNAIIRRLRSLEANTPCACDIESDGLNALNGAEPVCLGIAWSRSEALVIPWRRGHGVSFWSAAEEAMLLAELGRFFQSHPTIWHNGLWFDIPFLITNGWPLKLTGDYIDTIVMHRKLDPDSPHSLAYISSRYSTRPYWKDSFKNRPGSIYNMNLLQLWTYNGRDAMSTFEIYEAMAKELSGDFTIPAAPLVIAKKLHQITFNPEAMENFRNEARKDLKTIEAKMLELGRIPEGFNFNSDIHLNAFIFGVKKIAVQKRIVDESAGKAREIETKIASFCTDHADWSPDKTAKALKRFEATLEKIPTTARYLEAKAHLDLMAQIPTPYQATKLGFLARMSRTGLYSFDDITREKLLHQIGRRRAAIQSNLDKVGSRSERFIPGWKSDLAGLETLETWVKMFEYRKWLVTLIQSVGASEDVTGMPLEFLYRFGHYFKPTIGSAFFTAVAPPGGFSDAILQALSAVVICDPRDTFVILIRAECIVIEAPASRRATLDPLFDCCGARNLTEALTFMVKSKEAGNEAMV